MRGPIIVSRSIHDKAVGTFYPWASAVSFADGSFDVDEENLPLHGAIGAFGIRGLKGAVSRNLLEATGQYDFEAGKVYNLESSIFIKKGDGVSGAHSGHRWSGSGARVVAGVHLCRGPASAGENAVMSEGVLWLPGFASSRPR